MDQIPESIEPGGMFSGLKAWPIFAGAIADIISTYILGSILLFVLLYRKYGADIPQEALANITIVDDNILWFLILGVACTVLGGFVGSRIAGSEEIRHGGWVGAVSLIFSVFMELNTDTGETYPQWLTIISVAVVIPAGVLGGYIASIIKKKD